MLSLVQGLDPEGNVSASFSLVQDSDPEKTFALLFAPAARQLFPERRLPIGWRSTCRGESRHLVTGGSSRRHNTETADEWLAAP